MPQEGSQGLQEVGPEQEPRTSILADADADILCCWEHIIQEIEAWQKDRSLRYGWVSLAWAADPHGQSCVWWTCRPWQSCGCHSSADRGKQRGTSDALEDGVFCT